MAKTKPKRGRPLKDRAVRVLGTYLDESLQEELKEYAREVSVDEDAPVSHSDVVTRAVKAYRPFRRWRRERKASRAGG